MIIVTSKHVVLLYCNGACSVNKGYNKKKHTHTYTHTHQKTIFWLRRCHNPRLTNLFSVLLQSTDLYHHIHCIVYEEESRVYT